MMLELYNSYIRTARKPHQCEYCQKEIMVGKKYSYENGKFDGDFFTRTLCVPCRKMLNAYIDDVDDDTFDWLAVSDFLSENYCDKLCGQEKRHDCDKTPECCEKIRKAVLEKEREQ
nr:MAG TPA: hypothetical protein [Caudoviricetes sp.]